jgi:hypothetical protein
VNLKSPILTKVWQTCRSALKSGRRINGARLSQPQQVRSGQNHRNLVPSFCDPECCGWDTRAPFETGNSDKSRARDGSRCRKSEIGNGGAFTLIEILVVVVLMSFIVMALMAVFNATQAAFRASITQTDVLEGGRAAMGLIKSDLESMTPSYLNWTNPTPNIYAAVSNNFTQSLVGSSASHTYVMEDVFFITRENQTWKGVGYFVRTNILRANILLSDGIGTPGVLYRFETNYSVAQFARVAQTLDGPFTAFDLARRGVNPTNGVSRILDGVMAFKVRAYDPNGIWMTTNLVVNGTTNLNVWVYPTNLLSGNEPSAFYMFSNALPASVEIELGILEDRTLQRAESLPNDLPPPPNDRRTLYLRDHAGQVHLFRQRFPIRNVDPSAYQ